MRTSLRVMVLGLLMLTSSVAFAHGPVRQKVVEKINIAAAPDVVWGAIKNFGDMAWLPGVKSTDSANLPAGDGKCEKNSTNERVWVGTEEKSGAGTTPCATRTLTLDGGGTIEEVIKDYSNKKMEYAYKISKMSTVKTIQYSGEEVVITALPVSNYSATIQVKEGKQGGCEVIWKAAFYRGYMNNNPPPELTEEVAVNAVTGVFQKGLGNLKTTAEGK
ncbi:MAG: SRPBCC family protein [Methylococcales bacterium]